MFIREMFTKKFIKEYFHRNKNLIILSTVIFVLSVILGSIFSDSFKPIATELIRQMLEEIQMETVSQQAVSLFINNITANLVIMMGGLLFSIMSVFAILVNGLLIGYVSTLVNPFVFAVGTIPHGIFELSAIILSLTGAFIITKTELTIIQALFTKTLHEEYVHMHIYLKDVAFTLIMIFVLLIIAAIIEAAVTPLLLKMII